MRGAANITAHAQYLIYPKRAQEVNVYWGTGPELGFTRNLQQQGQRENLQLQFLGGMSGVFGAEWFATEHVSVFGEYGSNVLVRVLRSEQTNPSQQPATVESTATSLSLGMTVGLGLNLYF